MCTVISLKLQMQSSWAWLLRAKEMKGDYAGAYDSFLKLATLTKDSELESYQTAHANDGWLGVRKRIIDLSRLNEKSSGNYYDLAKQAALVGEKEKAFEYLDKAVEKRAWEIAFLRSIRNSTHYVATRASMSC